MANTMKRLLSFALALVMVFGLFPVIQMEAEAAITNLTAPTAPEGINDPITTTADAGTVNAPCKACGLESVAWEPLDATTSAYYSDGSSHHYYVPVGGLTNTGVVTYRGDSMFHLDKNSKVCLHLNGQDLTTTGNVLVVDAVFNLMGTGNWVSNRVTGSYDYHGFNVTSFNSKAMINLYGGTLTATNGTYSLGAVAGDAATDERYGVNIYPGVIVNDAIYQCGGRFNMYGGTVNGTIGMDTYVSGSRLINVDFNMFGGEITKRVRVTSGSFDMYGGVISGELAIQNGKFQNSGKTVTCYSSSAFSMSDGEVNNRITMVENTDAANNGTMLFRMTGGELNGIGTESARSTLNGSVMSADGGRIELAGGQVNGGYTSVNGGTIYLSGDAVLSIEGTTINGGNTTSNGGAVYMGGTSTCYMSAGTVQDGVAAEGGNFCLGTANNAVVMTGGLVTRGKATTTATNAWNGGGNFLLSNNSTLSVTNATISEGETINTGIGGNIMGRSSTVVDLNNGAILRDGYAVGGWGGGNYAGSDGILNVNAGAQVLGGGNPGASPKSISLIYSSVLNVKGGTLGVPGDLTAYTSGKLQAYACSNGSSGAGAKIYVYGGVVYGRLYTDNTYGGTKDVDAQLTVYDGTVWGTFTPLTSGPAPILYHGAFGVNPTQFANGKPVYKNPETNLYELHDAVGVETPADCEKDGFTTYTCTYSNTELNLSCNDVFVIAGEKAGHQLGDWVNGVKSCANCDYTETCPHTNTEQVGEVTATCVTDGRTADTKCTECGVVTVTGHAIPKESIPHGTAYKAAESADQHIKYCPVDGCTWSETESHTYTDGKCVCDAAEPQKVLKGSGTEEDPYQIGTLDELIIFRDDVNTKETVYGAAGVYVALTDNIDMSGIDWSKNIGDAADFSFAGIFDGRDHIITGLNSKETATDPYGYVCTGLFGCIEGDAVIKNLTIKEANIQADFVGNNAGFVVGFAYLATGTIENVHIVDSTMNAPAVTGTGALVGYDYCGKLTIKNCTVTNTDVTGAAYVGGVIGYANHNCTVSGCTFEDGDVKATSCCVGGIAGIMLGDSKAENNTVKNAQITADHANWQNSAAVVVGCISGGKVTVSGTVSENVNLTALVGSQHAEKPTTPVAKVQAVIGNDYYSTFAAAIKAAEAGQTVTLLDDVTLTEPVVATGKTVDLNGKTLTGDILATISVNNGAYNNIVGAANALCQSTDAVFSIEGASANITLISGTMKQIADMNIGANQTMTVLEGATYELPANVKLTIQGAVIAEGTLELEGSVVLTSVKATFQAAENLEVTTTVSDYEVSYANGVYSLKHKPVVVVKPEVEDVVVGNGDTEVTEEQKEAVKDVIEQVAQNQASAKVETGLVTNETANNKLKEELQTKDPEITEEKLEEAVKNAQTAVVITPTAVVLNESNMATKLTYEVEPVLLYEDVKVKIEVTDVVTFRLPVPDYIVAGTSVKVYHKEDLLGFYTVQTDGEGHNYVEVESKEFSPYSVELTDAVALLDGQEYSSFLDAMEAAAVNGGTVKLLQNVGVTEILMVMDNVTLDLNGFTLSSSSYVMAVFENSYIIDSSEGNTGRLYMDISKLRLLDANKQMAAQTEAGVMFADVKLEGKWSAKNNCFKFWFADTTDAAFINALKDGSEASKLKVLVELKWNGGANKMTYVFTDANLNDYLANWQAYSLTLSASGASSFADLSYTAKVIFADGAYAEVSAAAAAVSHGAQQ